MKVCTSQWIGKREKQEDTCYAKYYPDGVLMLVADGMGGHHHGALASQVAVQAFAEAFEASSGGATVAVRLRAALVAANEAVGQAFARCGAYGGTTLVAAYVSGGLLWWVSVGDSPLFLWRQRRLLRLNADHSLRAVYMECVRAGTMAYEEAMSYGHKLRSALTGEVPGLVDSPSVPQPLLPGDRVILASDGVDALLLPAILPEAVKDLLDTRAGASLAANLVEACAALGDAGADNTTVLTLDWPE